MKQELKVAANRVGVLIGKGGTTKKTVEERTKTLIVIDSREGLVHVEGEDTEGFLTAIDVINAINRGFSPERAFTLLDDEDLILDQIDLSQMADTTRQLDRLRGRIIGKDGKAREQIEDMTETLISVYGKTIAIIGLADKLKVARTAIDMLLSGVPHETVFSFLEKKKREAKEDLIEYYY